MKIKELYPCFQGEGKLTGKLSVLIRVAGCNLRCSYGMSICDSNFTWTDKDSKDMTVDEILQECKKFTKIHYIIISGGEPYLQTELADLTLILYKNEYHITIETNGTIENKGVRCHLYSMSPKLTSSIPRILKHRSMHLRGYHPEKIFRKNLEFYEQRQLKFVVTRESDEREIEEFQKQFFVDSDDIYLMPAGLTSQELNKKAICCQNIAMKHGWNYSDRVHIRVHGNQKRR